MREFADSVQDRRIANELQDAIHGSGAFRMFQNTIGHHKVAQQWYRFRQESLEEIARDWSQEHGIPWKSRRRCKQECLRHLAAVH